MQKEKERRKEGGKEERKRQRKKTHHIPLGGFGKNHINIMEKLLLFPSSLHNFAQLQMLRNENVASICIGRSFKLLIHIFPRTSLLRTNGWD